MLHLQKHSFSLDYEGEKNLNTGLYPSETVRKKKINLKNTSFLVFEIGISKEMLMTLNYLCSTVFIHLNNFNFFFQLFKFLLQFSIELRKLIFSIFCNFRKERIILLLL